MARYPYRQQPQMVDTGDVPYISYTSEQTEPLMMQAAANAQQRYDLAQTAIAKYLEENAAAKFRDADYNTAMAKLNQDLENIKTTVKDRYDNQYGQAYPEILKGLSKARQTYHLAQKAYEEEQKYAPLITKLAAEKKLIFAPNAKEEVVDPRTQSVFDETGQYRGGLDYSNIRERSDYDKTIEEAIVKGIDKTSDDTGLGRRLNGYFEQIKTKGLAALGNTPDEINKKVRELAEQYTPIFEAQTTYGIDPDKPMASSTDFIEKTIHRLAGSDRDVNYREDVRGNYLWKKGLQQPPNPVPPLSELVTSSEGAYSPKQLGYSPKDIIKNKTNDPFAREYYESVKSSILSKDENAKYRDLETLPFITLAKDKLKGFNIKETHNPYYNDLINTVAQDFADTYDGESNLFWHNLTNSGTWIRGKNVILQEYDADLKAQGVSEYNRRTNAEKFSKYLDEAAKTIAVDNINKRKELTTKIETEMENTPLNYNWLGGAYGTKAGDNMREMFDSGALDIKDLSPIITGDKEAYNEDYGFLGKDAYNALSKGITKVRVQRGDDTKPVSFALTDKEGKSHYVKYLGKNSEVVKDLAFRTNSPELYMDQLAYEYGQNISYSSPLRGEAVSIIKVKKSDLGKYEKVAGNKKYAYILIDNRTGQPIQTKEGGVKNASKNLQDLLEGFYQYNGAISPMQEYGSFVERIAATKKQNQLFGTGLED
jgi:hypothetical protein